MSDTVQAAAGDVLGPTPLVGGPLPDDGRSPRRAIKVSPALIASRLAARPGKGLTLMLTTSEARADEIGRALAGMADPTLEVLVLPPWDCLPYDHASPSRESQGRRLAVLDRLADPIGRKLLITSPEAALQRVPPPAAWSAAFDLTVGATLDREALEAFSRRTGYVVDDRIDEPGEIAFLGEVIDIYPAAEQQPVRLVLADGRIDSLRWFDPLSQRSEDELDALTLRGASELHLPDEEPREVGCEHRMGKIAGPLDSLFTLVEGAAILVEAETGDRCRGVLDQIADAHATALAFSNGGAPLGPSGLYLTADEVEAVLARASPIENLDDAAPSPIFAMERHPGRALRQYVEDKCNAGRRVVFAATEAELRLIGRFLKRHAMETPDPLATWSEVADALPGRLFTVVADPGSGFDDPQTGLTLLTATDALGGRVAQTRSPGRSLIGEPELRVGDVVIHEDHGLGVLQALERIEIDDLERDVLRLEYHGGATILAPVEEFDRIWRYGSEPDAVTLDRLGSDAWRKRRAEVSAQIDQTAARLVALAAEKAKAEAAPIVPPRQAYAAFVARFPYPESADQATAIGAVLEDLASGRPMSRLICGDVGFGKTEVALRAAAAVALSGRQVAVVAPTTVLARQHHETFVRRFRDTGLPVAHLSRLVDGAETSAVRAGLADGSIRIVVGTHALAADTVAFADLGLVIIDEEQRFGSKIKDALRSRADHALTLTATPIPRTLQAALVGLTEVSVIASPPARRRPIRTALTDYDAASLRTALLREKRRGGQTFVVCPRIEDLEPMRDRLEALVPELSVVAAHGKMPAAEVDEAMVSFAEGRGDILLATNIIESGLDVPRANTLVVWRPDRFGLTQLHQLRGRIGRGRAQGFAYLVTEPDDDLADATRARLGALEAFDRLGSGFALSARDLDLRGGGDLVGDEQAGHMKLIGASLYQRVLERAVRTARGEELPPDLSPPRIGDTAYLPEDFIPDATMRINLYARLARVVSSAEVDALEDEVGDRFGPPPPPVTTLIAATRLSALAAEAGVTKISTGPKATAFTLSAARAKVLRPRLPDTGARRWADDRLIFEASSNVEHDHAFLTAALADLAA
ncbi:DEAD/DEAH box helicase [Brevundimonas lutea]|uniref:DEAD/DEAH box helicase n=1 Tax=Brevundimonas lutea TaxID=2293980 RepID=UPI000F02D78D|nr:DEAD/DEAH box helicase [Brevundimonas lutea]